MSLVRVIADATKAAAALRTHATIVESHAMPPHLRELARELQRLTKEAYLRAHVLRREIAAEARE